MPSGALIATPRPCHHPCNHSQVPQNFGGLQLADASLATILQRNRALASPYYSSSPEAALTKCFSCRGQLYEGTKLLQAAGDR